MSKEPIDDLRAAIETVDRDIVACLRRRMDLAARIAAAKIEAAAPVRDPAREQQVLDRVRTQALEAGLDPRAVETVYKDILAMSIAEQQGPRHDTDPPKQGPWRDTDPPKR